jgi:integrase
MARRRKKSTTWSTSIEAHGVRVRIYERSRGGTLYVEVRGVTGKVDGKDRRSLGHRDRALARDQARALSRSLAEARLTGVAPDTLTFGQLFATYCRERMPQLTPARQSETNARMMMFTEAWGSNLLVADVDQSRVDRYCQLRRSGEVIAPCKRRAAQGKRRRGYKRPRPIRDGALDVEFPWLRSVLRWARRFRVNGHRLLVENPVDGLTWPREKNPRRPIASHERYVRTMERADTVDPVGRLRCILALARHTGRRESAICALRADDLLLSRDRIRAALAAAGLDERLADHMPHGAARWRESADKGGYLFVSPMGAAAREAVDRYLQAMPRMGDVPLFPAPTDDTVSVRRETVAKWLLNAERLANLPKLVGGTFHPYRRLWASERKHLPDADVAAAGGWKDTGALRQSYLQADGATVLRVVENEAAG